LKRKTQEPDNELTESPELKRRKLGPESDHRGNTEGSKVKVESAQSVIEVDAETDIMEIDEKVEKLPQERGKEDCSRTEESKDIKLKTESDSSEVKVLESQSLKSTTEKQTSPRSVDHVKTKVEIFTPGKSRMHTIRVTILSDDEDEEDTLVDKMNKESKQQETTKEKKDTQKSQQCEGGKDIVKVIEGPQEKIVLDIDNEKGCDVGVMHVEKDELKKSDSIGSVIDILSDDELDVQICGESTVQSDSRRKPAYNLDVQSSGQKKPVNDLQNNFVQAMLPVQSVKQNAVKSVDLTTPLTGQSSVPHEQLCRQPQTHLPQLKDQGTVIGKQSLAASKTVSPPQSSHNLTSSQASQKGTSSQPIQNLTSSQTSQNLIPSQTSQKDNTSQPTRKLTSSQRSQKYTTKQTSQKCSTSPQSQNLTPHPSQKLSPPKLSQKLSPSPPSQKLSPSPPSQKLSPSLPSQKLTPSPPSQQLSPSLPSQKLTPSTPSQQLSPSLPSQKLTPSTPSQQLSPSQPSQKLSPSQPSQKLSPSLPSQKLSPSLPSQKLSPSLPGKKLSPLQPNSKPSPNKNSGSPKFAWNTSIVKPIYQGNVKTPDTSKPGAAGHSKTVDPTLKGSQSFMKGNLSDLVNKLKTLQKVKDTITQNSSQNKSVKPLSLSNNFQPKEVYPCYNDNASNRNTGFSNQSRTGTSFGNKKLTQNCSVQYNKDLVTTKVAHPQNRAPLLNANKEPNSKVCLKPSKSHEGRPKAYRTTHSKASDIIVVDDIKSSCSNKKQLERCDSDVIILDSTPTKNQETPSGGACSPDSANDPKKVTGTLKHGVETVGVSDLLGIVKVKEERSKSDSEDEVSSTVSDGEDSRLVKIKLPTTGSQEKSGRKNKQKNKDHHSHSRNNRTSGSNKATSHRTQNVKVMQSTISPKRPLKQELWSDDENARLIETYEEPDSTANVIVLSDSE